MVCTLDYLYSYMRLCNTGLFEVIEKKHSKWIMKKKTMYIISRCVKKDNRFVHNKILETLPCMTLYKLISLQQLYFVRIVCLWRQKFFCTRLLWNVIVNRIHNVSLQFVTHIFYCLFVMLASVTALSSLVFVVV